MMHCCKPLYCTISLIKLWHRRKMHLSTTRSRMSSHGLFTLRFLTKDLRWYKHTSYISLIRWRQDFMPKLHRGRNKVDSSSLGSIPWKDPWVSMSFSNAIFWTLNSRSLPTKFHCRWYDDDFRSLSKCYPTVDIHLDCGVFKISCSRWSMTSLSKSSHRC